MWVGVKADVTALAGLLLFYFDTNSCHADIPTGVKVQSWRAGIHHSV